MRSGSAMIACHRHARVERGVGVLEHELHPLAQRRAARGRSAWVRSAPSKRTDPRGRRRAAASASGRWSTCRSRTRRRARASRPGRGSKLTRRHTACTAPTWPRSSPARIGNYLTRSMASSSGADRGLEAGAGGDRSGHRPASTGAVFELGPTLAGRQLLVAARATSSGRTSIATAGLRHGRSGGGTRSPAARRSATAAGRGCGTARPAPARSRRGSEASRPRV